MLEFVQLGSWGTSVFISSRFYEIYQRKNKTEDGQRNMRINTIWENCISTMLHSALFHFIQVVHIQSKQPSIASTLSKIQHYCFMINMAMLPFLWAFDFYTDSSSNRSEKIYGIMKDLIVFGCSIEAGNLASKGFTNITTIS